MKFHTIKYILLLVLTMGYFGIIYATIPYSELKKGFVQPPPSAKTCTWWHWINGNVSKAGITADLEAMKAIRKNSKSFSSGCKINT